MSKHTSMKTTYFVHPIPSFSSTYLNLLFITFMCVKHFSKTLFFKWINSPFSSPQGYHYIEWLLLLLFPTNALHLPCFLPMFFFFLLHHWLSILFSSPSTHSHTQTDRHTHALQHRSTSSSHLQWMSYDEPYIPH